MSKTLTPSSPVTTRDPKGRKFIEVAESAFNKAGLSEDEAQRVLETGGLKEIIDSFIAEHRHEVPSILKLVANGIKASGSKRFVVNEASLKEANIGWTGENFKEHFLGKVEENITDATLAIHRLEQSALDAPIRKELGSERGVTTLAYFFNLIKKQSNGQKGHLLVNGYANIAYIRDKKNTLWAVRARWLSFYGYWLVDAYSVENPLEWLAGYQILSRDS